MSETEVERGQGGRQHTFEITVDGESVEVAEHEMTPRQIMEAAGLDPDARYLVEIRGKEQISYKDTPDSPIHIHEHQKFVTNESGPTPVS
jgi:hypothetical protein